MRRQGLGVALGAREVRAAMVGAGIVQWHATASFSGVGSIANSLRELLSQAPRLPLGARTTVVIAPAWVQVKSLHGLPTVKPARLASQLLRENQQTFFLWKGSSALIPDIHRAVDGASWGAAFDKDAVDEITRAFRTARTTVGRVAPTVVAMVAAFPNRSIVWSDGEDRFELEGDGGGLRRVERSFDGKPTTPPELAVPLAALGDDAHCFLDAYAAAVSPRRLSLVCQLDSDEARSHSLKRLRRATAAIALSAAAGFAALGPGVHARTFARVASGELVRNRRAQVELARDENELRRVTQTVNRVESFRAGRGMVTRILGELAESIPESTAMLTFHLDSVEGAFTAIAPHVADVLPELGSVRGIVEPRIVGSVTREVLGGARVERATFRFRCSRMSSAAPLQVRR